VTIGTPALYVLPFSIPLLYQHDDGPLVGSKHVAFVKIYKMGFLEGSGVSVLYIGRTVPEG
jgi:hypothetical protein